MPSSEHCFVYSCPDAVYMLMKKCWFGEHKAREYTGYPLASHVHPSFSHNTCLFPASRTQLFICPLHADFWTAVYIQHSAENTTCSHTRDCNWLAITHVNRSFLDRHCSRPRFPTWVRIFPSFWPICTAYSVLADEQVYGRPRGYACMISRRDIASCLRQKRTRRTPVFLMIQWLGPLRGSTRAGPALFSRLCLCKYYTWTTSLQISNLLLLSDHEY